MNRKVAECTAAALALSLTLGGMSTTYAATTMTLAGFGAGTQTESTAPQTEAAQEETVKETEAAQKAKEEKKAKKAAKETVMVK